MRIRALVGFAGKDVAMAMGEVFDVPDPIANDLIKAGYAEKIEGETQNVKSKVSKAHQRKKQQ